MTTKNWLLTDVEQDVHVEQCCLGPRDVAPDVGAAGGVPFQVCKRTLRGGLRDGVEIVEVDNGAICVTVLPTRGMGLWRVACGELTLGWRSPVRGPVHPRFVPLYRGDGCGWLTGFDELLVRCGLESNGAPVFGSQGEVLHPLHGRIANLPAQRLELEFDAAASALRLRGVVDESRLYGQKLRLTSTIELSLGSREVRIFDEIENRSSQPAELALLYHVNFGPPLLEPGASVVAPVRTLVPQTTQAAEGIASWNTYAAPESGYFEQVFLFELHSDATGQTQAMLRNAHGNLGARLRFNLQELPRFTVWKSTEPEGDGYVTGLEPSINYPNPRAFEQRQGRLKRLAPGEVYRCGLALEALDSAARVADAEEQIRRLAQEVQAVVHRAPLPDWSPEGVA